jgi:eukaryotic-like serine/threonine-protein kinase
VPDLREVEIRIAVAEGLLSRTEAQRLSEEARQKRLSPLALLVARGRVSEESYQSLFAAALNDPVWRAEAHEGSASTYTMNDPPPPTSADPPFPVASWDRYTNIRFLGQGGMGKVYLAVDNRLRREVAIKFVRGDDAEHVRRLIAEARTQARVNHERICKVYEVDEVEGKVYIAMQYIHGKPLGRCAGELTVEQKVMLVRGAAEGIHEAHRVGIVHRDIKPSNIMVERSDDGEIRPYVMDFGLAHSAQEAGSTQTGAVLGTPRYMSPEQAHGSAAKLDRRADVYSLGATLYHMVTGEPPVPGETIAEVIANLVTVEPRPLRALDPSLPVDLEAIVHKCLEKERAARYDSARALADDLGRFLNGEPVVARPAGTWYRLRKRLIKHRRLVVAAAAALVVLGVAIGWAIKTRLDSGERERLARRFTERVEQIEAIARYSALAPLHDIRGDRARITAQMAELGAEIHEAGDIAAGPGHYALGRGYLALDDDERALQELEAAWDPRAPDPRVAYSLAIVSGHLYQKALFETDRIEQEDQRAAKRRAIEARYRGPVLGYLAASKGAEMAPTAFVAARVAFYDGKFDAALRELDAIADAQSWYYEVPELRGDILLARGKQRRDHGDRDLARRDFNDSRIAYGNAAAIGRSAPAIYTSIGDLEYAVMTAEFYDHGDVKPAVERVLTATRNALTVLPDHYDALVLEALVRRTQAEHEADRGGKVEDLLARAQVAAERAAKVGPGRPQALLEMAQIQRQWGDFHVSRNEDPSAQFAKAIEISNQIAARDRDAPYWGNLGLIYSLWADYEDLAGRDSEANRGKSDEAYGRALQLDHQLAGVWVNVGINSYMRASRPRAIHPDAALQHALAAFDKAKAIDRKQVAAYFNVGQSRQLMAQLARSHGADPGPDLEAALVEYRAARDLSRDFPNFDNGIGSVLMEQASIAWEHGRDPEPLLRDAEAAFRRAAELAPESGYAYDNTGEVLVQRAWLARARGNDPRAHVEAAIDQFRQATERIPNNTTFWADLGMAHAIVAGYDLDHGRDPKTSLDAAATALQKAVASNQSDAQSQLYIAEVSGLRARLAAREGRGKPDELAEVARAFQQAIELAPDNQDYRLVFGQFCHAWAAAESLAGRDASAAFDAGLRVVNAVLDRRPGWPDALVLRASLELLQAQAASDAARRALAASARRDFATALDTNHALGAVWNREAALAQQLARSR